VFVVTLASFGCAAKRPAGINYLVPVSDVSKVELLNCDHNSPPNCRHAKVWFRRGAEQIEAK
jgi:hypothetical protein